MRVFAELLKQDLVLTACRGGEANSPQLKHLDHQTVPFLDDPLVSLGNGSCGGSPSDGLLHRRQGACQRRRAASGLGRTFFYAGTRALLVTNWSVHSQSACELVTNLFKLQANNPKLTRGEALREAMMALADRPGYLLCASAILGALYPHR
jgi:CHAT domain